MAGDAAVTSVILGAPGQTGSPQVVTAAGLVFVQAPAPAATSAYWNYDGSNLVGNVPATKGFSFTVGGTQAAGLTATAMTIPAASSFTATSDGTVGRVGNAASWGISGTSGRIGHVMSTVGDGAASVATFIGATAPYATAGAVLARFGSNFAGTHTAHADIFAVASANPTGYQSQAAFAHMSGASTALTLNTCRIGLGAGTTSSGTAVTASGHDLAGRVGVTVNSTGTANQPVLLIAFAQNYNTPPYITLTPANASAASAAAATMPFAVATTSGFAIMGNATGLAAATYAWHYKVIQ